MTLWFIARRSCLRGTDAGGGIGFVKAIELLARERNDGLHCNVGDV